MDYRNYDKCPLSKRSYGGSERKLGILLNGQPYMLKFRKRTPFGYRYNTISEYLGSHIYQSIGIPCQDTLLGTYHNEEVVACKDFLTDGFQFVPFNDVGESTIEEDKNLYQYTYDDIMHLLVLNKKLTDVEESISSFFDIYIVDALIGNSDRHGGNWGFLKKDNKYTLAPVFDNGSCLYPNMTDEDEMRKILSDEEQINARIYDFPTSQIKINNKKSSYFEVISSLQFDEINKSLIKIYTKIDLNVINALIDDIPSISDTHKEFYRTMIEQRYKKIIRYSYERLVG